ncbi:MAG: transposase [Nitrososphaera sp.]|nr:transposase [Nitrososphaera sp.]
MAIFETVIKSVKKPFQPSPEISSLMETFRQMVNDCVRIGLSHDITTRMTLASLAYKKLSCYNIVSYYKLCAISHAAGILANRKKSIKRGLRPRKPYARRPLLISCYGFKVEECEILKIPIGGGHYYDIALNRYFKNGLSNTSFRIRAFTLTPDSLSISYSKEVKEIECRDVVGLDRNLRNVTVADSNVVMRYDLSKAVDVAENTRSIMRSFKRNDVRIRKKLYRKYGLRRKRRTNQLLHRLTKAIVRQAKQSRSAIAFEDIRHIRKLYQKGNYQGRSYRARLNGWSFAEVKRQIEYKAKWEGLPIIQLSRSETRGTSQLCPRCGKKITQVDRFRQLWCAECKKWMDRDVVAAMNISIKGLARFASSKGLAGEAMKGNPATPVILRVDASKLICSLNR